MNLSYDSLKDPSFSKDKIKFPGFDKNNELKYLSFALFFRDYKNAFSFLNGEDINSLNSHIEMIEQYKKILLRFNSVHKKNLLSEQDIKTILDI